MTNEFTDTAPAALRDFKPEIGLVLGSGLGSLVERLDVHATVPFSEITGLPQSRVAGHAGRFVFAGLGGIQAIIAQGRVHLYEGHSAREVAAGIRWMAALGISRLVLTNAAGSAHPEFEPGTWMMLKDHINLTGTSPLVGGPHFVDMSAVYSPDWRADFQRAATEEGIALHEGVYAGVPGPQYETPAEVRMLRQLGADAIGMSTVLEAIQARALGLEIAAFSCLSNWAAGLAREPLSHAEVLETGKRAGEDFFRLLERATCPAGRRQG